MHEFDKCILTSISGAGLAEGTVREFNEPVMRIGLSEEQQFMLHSEVIIFVFNRIKGECVYKGRIAEIDGDTVAVDRVVFVRSTQKRNNTRVGKTIHYKVTHKFTGDEKEKLEKPIELLILNVSATGIYVSSDEKFVEGHRFPLRFLEAGKPIDLEVEVIRCEYSRRGNKYGCQFLNINPKDADNIYRFVLHEQIEQRRNNLFF
jgi:hypothetical protein